MYSRLCNNATEREIPWQASRRGMAMVAAVVVHAAVIAAVISLPSARKRLIVPPVLDVVMVHEERRPPPAPVPVAPPRVREVTPVIVPIPEVRMAMSATNETITARSARLVAEAEPLPIADSPTPSKASVEPPRFDMAYLRNPAPAYPPISRRLKEEGRVILRVRVSSAGEARDVLVGTSSGFERLDRAAIEAVRNWRFSPAKRGTEPVEAWAMVPISFRLDA